MKKELWKTAGLISLGLSLVIGAESHENDCGVQWRLSGKDHKVLICKTEEGRIVAQGETTPERLLPEEITSIYFVWSSWNGNGRDIGYYQTEYLDSHYLLWHEWRMDLESGEERYVGTFCEWNNMGPC